MFAILCACHVNFYFYFACWRYGLNGELLVKNEIQPGFESSLDLNFIFPNKQLSKQKNVLMGFLQEEKCLPGQL